MSAARIRVGTASWTDHSPFYPPAYEKASGKSQRIAYYAQYFNMVEVDSTFYTLQPARNFQLWADRTPDDFVFDVKAYGELTWHHRDEEGTPQAPHAETFAQFREMLAPLRPVKKLGAILFQFPPWFTASPERMEYLASLREFMPEETLVVEFRHRSWVEGAQVQETRAVLADHDLAYCAVDEPQVGSGSVPPLVLLTSPRFSMVRFHGRNTRMWYAKNLKSSRDRFDYLYSREELAPWAARIQRIAEQLAASEVHVVTNNNAANHSIVNALDLQDLLGLEVGLGTPLPEAILAAQQARAEREAEGTAQPEASPAGEG